MGKPENITEGNDGDIIKDKEPAINERSKVQLYSELSDEINNMHGRMRVLDGQILADIEQYRIKYSSLALCLKTTKKNTYEKNSIAVYIILYKNQAQIFLFIVPAQYMSK